MSKRESYEETIKRLSREQRQVLQGDKQTLEQRIEKLELIVANLQKQIWPYGSKND